MKAAIYGRYSSDMRSKTSIDGQFRNCTEFCKRKGFEIVARFSDEAVSGTVDDRVGYKALLDALERGDVEAVVVDETSRLSRNPGALPALLDQLAFRNQALLDCKGFDSREPSAMLLAGLYGGMDRMELDKLKARTHRGLRERALGGYWTGGRIFGYRTVAADPADPRSKRTLVIEQTEAAVVRQIAEAYAAGESLRAIVNNLNARGVPSPGAKWKRTQRRTRGWTCSALVGTCKRESGLLRCEVYGGTLTWNKRRTKNVPGTSRRLAEMRPRSEWVVVPAPELRIVAESTWTLVQQRLAKNAKLARERHDAGKGYHRTKHLLSGLLKCGVCDSS